MAPLQRKPAEATLGDGSLPNDQASVWARSEDLGKTWGLLTLQAGRQTVNRFTLSTDARFPRLLVARSDDPHIPADRRYLSADSGHTWRSALCAGDLRGQCPAFVLDNVFGAGRSYGFYRDGLHAFSGSGPAGARLPLSARLPLAPASLMDVEGGRTPGDPVYLLGRRGTGACATGIYRSVETGRAWRCLQLGATP